MATSVNGNQINIADIAITDTSTHTYRTDPYNSKTTKGILLLEALKNRIPVPTVVAIYIQNGSAEELTFQVTGNIDDSETYNDVNLQAGKIDASSQDFVYAYVHGYNVVPADYIALSLSFATAPSSGSVIAFARFQE